MFFGMISFHNVTKVKTNAPIWNTHFLQHHLITAENGRRYRLVLVLHRYTVVSG